MTKPSESQSFLVTDDGSAPDKARLSLLTRRDPVFGKPGPLPRPPE